MVDLAIKYSKNTGCTIKEAKDILDELSFIIKDNIEKESVLFYKLGTLNINPKNRKQIIIRTRERR